MDNWDKLLATGIEHAQKIARLETRADATDDDVSSIRQHMAKLDEALVVMREGLSRVATRDDIHRLQISLTDAWHDDKDERAERGTGDRRYRRSLWLEGAVLLMFAVETMFTIMAYYHHA